MSKKKERLFNRANDLINYLNDDARIEDMMIFEELLEKIVPAYGKSKEEGHIWQNGEEILCVSEEDANRLADAMEDYWWEYGYGVDVVTGYYDPEEDKKMGETDSLTGFCYVSV